ncbi:putative ATP-dependent DNA helicase RecS [Oculina patagonica]
MRTAKEALKIAQQVTGNDELKEYQQQAIEAYLCGKNVFVSVPTKASKSLTFELAPFALDYMRNGGDTTIVLVVVPLVSLMKEQVYSLQNRGIGASYVGDDCSDEQLKDIIDLKFRIIFGGPEALHNIYHHIFRRLKVFSIYV